MKKFFALAMALVMCLGLLAGCGQDSGATTSAAPTDGDAAAENTASGESASFKFGGVGPLTGDNAIYGTAVMNGIQIAVDEVNAARRHQRLSG